jgi:hypothetical protein
MGNTARMPLGVVHTPGGACPTSFGMPAGWPALTMTEKLRWSQWGQLKVRASDELAKEPD